MVRDKLFLLSIEELEKYLPTSESRICFFEGIKCWWWLRSIRHFTHGTGYVWCSDYMKRDGIYVNYYYDAVRPALHLNLNSLKRNKEGCFMFGSREWIVLDEEIGLLLAKDAVCKHYFDNFDKKSKNYETSEIREFLNNELYQEMFSEEEQEMIIDTIIDGEKSHPAN